MNIKSIKKNMSKLLRFPEEMYTDTTGSLMITLYMFANTKPDVKAYTRKWRINDIRFDDPEYLNKVIEYSGIKPHFDDKLELYMYISDFNVLFGPVIEGTNLPIREDGIFAVTYRKGKAYKVEL